MKIALGCMLNFESTSTKTFRGTPEQGPRSAAPIKLMLSCTCTLARLCKMAPTAKFKLFIQILYQIQAQFLRKMNHEKNRHFETENYVNFFFTFQQIKLSVRTITYCYTPSFLY